MIVQRFINNNKINGEFPKMQVDNKEVITMIKTIQSRTSENKEEPDNHRGSTVL